MMNEQKKIEGMKVIFTENEISEITKNIAAVLRSGHLIKGLFLDDFALRIGRRCGKANVALCSSDTSAMEMLFVALDVKDRIVIFQGNMFPSPIFACMRAGGVPRYADMEMVGLGMSAKSLDALIKGLSPTRVAAVVVMHTAGIISTKFFEVVDVCRQNGIILIEDCAHAYGSRFDGAGAGSWGDYTVFSFYSTKPMNTGEGGAVCSNNAVIVEAVEMLARYGKTEIFGPPLCEFAGYSNRMTELLAAVGVVTDGTVDKKIERRQQIARIYDSEIKFAGMSYSGDGQNYYKYVLMPDNSIDREYFRSVMRGEFNIGIPAGVYDFPVYNQPPLKNTRPAEPLPNTTRFCFNHICLPMHEGLSDEDVMFVARAVNEVLGE